MPQLRPAVAIPPPSRDNGASTSSQSGRRMSRQQGFTLIEIAIVLAILGILISSGLLAVAPVMDNNRRTQTSQNFDQIEAALLSYVMQNNRLPCPADGALTNTSAFYGLEGRIGGVLPPNTGLACLLPTPRNGVVPWRTLGLPEGQSRDGWGRRISYVVQAAYSGHLSVAPNLDLTTTAAAPTWSTTGNLQRNPTFATAGYPSAYPNGKIAVCSALPCLTGGGSPTEDTQASALTPAPTKGAAYVLISHGKAGFGSWSTTSPTANVMTAANASTSLLQAQNMNTLATGTAWSFIDAPMSTTFDDMVRWKTPAAIIQACGSNACGNP